MHGVLSIFTIIMHLDNHDYKNHDDLIIITINNHDISIFNNNCPTLLSMELASQW